MPTFKYVAKNKDSRTVAGRIAAESQVAVIEELRKRQLVIISLAEIKEEGGGRRGSLWRKKVKADEIVIFARQLATMVDAGIPIVQGLDALQDQVTHPFFKKVLIGVRDDIQHGSSLAAAFARHPNVFDGLFVNMIKVGETGGVLSAILERISSYLEKTLRLKRKVKSALIYPLVVVSLAVIITVVLLVKVVPTFKGIYDSFGQDLPAMTQMLLTVSDALKRYLLWFVAGAVVMIVLLRQWSKTGRGALMIDQAILKMPIFGELMRKVAISRFSRTLATLIQSGVPILESLEIVGKTIQNRVLELVIDDVKESVRQGESLAAPLMKSGVFPPMVTRMISIGEKSGQMEKMLLKIAEFYDDQVDAAVDGLTSIIEPLVIGVLGIIIGFIVIALFLPILTMVQIL